MVFIVIPPTDVDVGSPVDEKLMETIKVDLDDLDSRTTQNTTDITALGGGGGGGGGYNNRLYFDAPGNWTSPATIQSGSSIYGAQGSSGGSGGSSGSYVGIGGKGGNGGNSTATSIGTRTLVALTGGIAVTPNPATPTGPSFAGLPGANASSYATLLNLHFDNATTGLLSISTGGSGGAALPPWGSSPGIGPGGVGGAGGNVYSGVFSTTLGASTVLAVQVGQAGAGGGGGSGGQFPLVNGQAGANGGLVPLAFFTITGTNGAVAVGYSGGAGGGPNGGVGGVLPGAGTAGSGASGGGGTGVHGYMFLYFND